MQYRCLFFLQYSPLFTLSTVWNIFLPTAGREQCRKSRKTGECLSKKIYYRVNNAKEHQEFLLRGEQLRFKMTRFGVGKFFFSCFLALSFSSRIQGFLQEGRHGRSESIRLGLCNGSCSPEPEPAQEDDAESAQHASPASGAPAEDSRPASSLVS